MRSQKLSPSPRSRPPAAAKPRGKTALATKPHRAAATAAAKPAQLSPSPRSRPPAAAAKPRGKTALATKPRRAAATAAAKPAQLSPSPRSRPPAAAAKPRGKTALATKPRRAAAAAAAKPARQAKPKPAAREVEISALEVVGDPLCITYEDGRKVFRKICAALKKEGQTVALSFRGVTDLTAPFLCDSIGKLYGKFPEKEIRKRLRVKDLQPGGEISVEAAVETALRYYADPVGFRKRVRAILSEYWDCE